MDWKRALEQIINNHQEISTPSRLRFDEPLSKHSHFGIGGRATAYVEVRTINELAEIARLSTERQLPVAVIGRGSNLLISDEGFNGLVIRLAGDFDRLDFDGNHVLAGAGVSQPKLSKRCAVHGLSGMEFALGIPGSVGGGLIMNAGAWGSCFADMVECVQVISDTGEVIELSHSEAQFGYRHSRLDTYFCIIGAWLKLTPDDVETVTGRMHELYEKKISTQPFTEENAGCMFKNPPDDSAGRLIDVCGLKGYRVGGAEVSTIHGNFILNIDHATAHDVITLVGHIQREVKRQKGIELKMEVKLLGNLT